MHVSQNSSMLHVTPLKSPLKTHLNEFNARVESGQAPTPALSVPLLTAQRNRPRHHSSEVPTSPAESAIFIDAVRGRKVEVTADAAATQAPHKRASTYAYGSYGGCVSGISKKEAAAKLRISKKEVKKVAVKDAEHSHRKLIACRIKKSVKDWVGPPKRSMVKAVDISK